MSELSERMLAATSKPAHKDALLVLEDGTAYRAVACAAPGEVFGEICFNTSVEGYLEVISDPSYAGQIVTMTYPQIGNYGVCLDDVQSGRPALRGLVVGDMCRTPSNWRSGMPLHAYLEREGVVAVEGVDTRSLVRHIREHGAMRAGVSTEDTNVESLLQKVRASASIVGQNLVRGVSCAQPYTVGLDQLAQSTQSREFALAQPSAPKHRVVAYDCGVKHSILEGLVRTGCEVTVVPWDTPAHDALAYEPDGVFLSNGPGDPDAVAETYGHVRDLLGRVPIFGICLGHQMLCKAAGARIEKLAFGHHGANHPVMNLRTGRVEVTSQNHGFNLVFPSLGPLVPQLSGGVGEHVDDLRFWVERSVAPVVDNPRYGRIQLTHVNLNDGTAEGMAFMDVSAFSVQYHPEANPGPNDAGYLFEAFSRLMDNRSDYLDIDIAKSRLQGWRF